MKATVQKSDSSRDIQKNLESGEKGGRRHGSNENKRGHGLLMAGQDFFYLEDFSPGKCKDTRHVSELPAGRGVCHEAKDANRSQGENALRSKVGVLVLAATSQVNQLCFRSIFNI